MKFTNVKYIKLIPIQKAQKDLNLLWPVVEDSNISSKSSTDLKDSSLQPSAVEDRSRSLFLPFAINIRKGL